MQTPRQLEFPRRVPGSGIPFPSPLFVEMGRENGEYSCQHPGLRIVCAVNVLIKTLVHFLGPNLKKARLF